MSKQMESIITHIRNVLRKEGITGMDSVSHCIVFVVFRMMTPKLCKSVGIDESLAFENAIIDEDGTELGAQSLYDKFYYKNNKELNFVGEFVNKLKFTNFKFKMEGIHNLKTIVDKLKDLDIDDLKTKYDIIGTVYELHLKSGTSKGAMRDLGQYYTHRLVIKYMIELCKPVVKKGIVEKIVDPTMGTGGFLTMSIKYLNEKYKGDKAIDWKKNKDNIIGFDIDDNVKNMALLNVFLEIGQLCKDTIVKQDTLHNDLMFPDSCKILDKADVILANEPMGLKNIIHANCCERIKEMKIRGTKAEPLFMQLFMEALNDGGRCAVVVPDGVLFNESTQHQETRKYLVENFNLKKVTSLKDDDFFLNTGVKTSILFFAKDGNKTKEVDFCDITIDKGEIVETSIIKVSYKNIKSNSYTLFVNKYNITDIDKIDGIEYIHLESILEKRSGKSLSRKNMNDGNYPVISGGVEYGGYHDEYNYDENLIFIARVGSAGHISYYNDKCYVTDLVGAYSVIDKRCIFKYVYYYLKHNESTIKNDYIMTTGAPSINLGNFVNKYEIPIPSLKVQEVIVERLDLLSENNKTMELNIEQLKKVIQYYLGSKLQYVIKTKLSKICIINPENLNTSDKYDFINYIDIGSVNNGIISTYEKLTDDYPSRAKRKISKGDTIISTVRPNLKNYAYVYEDIKNGIVSTGFCVIRSLNNKVLDKFIYYVISMNNTTEYLTRNATGSSYPAVNSSIVSNIEVPLPPKNIQSEIVEYCDNLTDIIHKQEKQIELNKELMKQIMDNYLSSNKDIVDISDDDKFIEDSETDIDTNDKKSKSSIKKKKSGSDDSEDTKSTKSSSKKKIAKKKISDDSESDSDTKSIKSSDKKKVIKKSNKKDKSDSDDTDKKKKVKVIKKNNDSKIKKIIMKNNDSDSDSDSDGYNIDQK